MTTATAPVEPIAWEDYLVAGDTTTSGSSLWEWASPFHAATLGAIRGTVQRWDIEEAPGAFAPGAPEPTHYRRSDSTIQPLHPDRKPAAAKPKLPELTAVRAEAIADAIRAADGRVWPAMAEFRISYNRALSIRSGWRPGGVTAPRIAHLSRGYAPDGKRPGESWDWEDEPGSPAS